MRLFTVTCIFTVLSLLVSSLSTRAQNISDSPYRITARTIPIDFMPAVQFLEFIKFPKEPEDVFNPQEAPRWDVSRFMAFISARGVIFSDVNGRLRGPKSPDQIRTALASRRSQVFERFAHLAHIYSIPYKQYSELRFGKKEGRFIVEVSHWYRLTFISEGGRLRLRKCDYLTLEGD